MNLLPTHFIHDLKKLQKKQKLILRVSKLFLTEKVFNNYYLIKPVYFDTADKETASGYTLSVETRSFGKVISKNLISTIEIYPVELPEPTLQGETLQSDLKVNDIKKWGTSIYKVETTGSGVLELGQGYEKGWISYPVLEHVNVNSWANGWIVPTNLSALITNHYLIFWPQFLEWGGFVLLVFTVIYLLKNKTSKT